MHNESGLRRFVQSPLFSALLFTISLVAIMAVLDYINIGLERGIGYSALIFASFGASGFVMFMMPNSFAAHRRVFVRSYLIGSIVGFAGSLLIGIAGIYVAAAIVLLVTAMLLYYTKNEHPPAMALAFAFVLFNVGFAGVIITVVGVILLLASKTFEKRLYSALKIPYKNVRRRT